MYKTFDITNEEKDNILKMYGIKQEDNRTPLEKLRECRLTVDYKSVFFEGKYYNINTGYEIVLTEDFDTSWSNILHTGADLLSAGLDFVIPGSGAVVDALNGISYIIEGYYTKDENEKNNLYIYAAISFASILMPGPLQFAMTSLRNFIKTGKGFVSKTVIEGLKTILSNLNPMLSKVPTTVNNSLQSPLAKNILGKWGKYIGGFISDFSVKIKQILTSLLGKVSQKSASKQLTKEGSTRLMTFFNRFPKISNPVAFLKKLGYVKGKTYGYMVNNTKCSFTIVDVVGDKISGVIKYENGVTKKINTDVQNFSQNAIKSPWIRRAQFMGVNIVQWTLASFVNEDGTINEEEFNNIEDLDPDLVSDETLSYSGLPQYEGDKGRYTVNDTVKYYQMALKLLGFNLGTYGENRDGVDGKFGPNTKNAIMLFQKNNQISNPNGSITKETNDKLIEKLSGKPNSEPIIDFLKQINFE